MATYVRQSSFSDGDTITAALFNNEFNQLVNAFDVATGHTHDGSTAGDGGPLSNLFSNALVFGTNTNNDIAITFNATSNDGVLTWMEDEDYFKFSDDILLTTTEKVQFRDTAIYINSSTDGQLDIVADTEIQIAATTIDINGNADISGNLGVGGNLTVTGTTTFNGGTITMGDAATDNVVFGADVDSNIIPDDDDSYDLGSSTQEWRNLYIDGTANIDSLVADTADINGGTIDAANITVGSGKTLDVSAGTLTLADNQISGDKVEGGTINATTINTLTYGSITDGTITVTAFVDEDNMASNSATLIPTQQSVKAYVDAQDTAQDLDLVSDSGTIAIDLDGETLTVTGGEGIDTSASSNTLTITGEDATTSNKGIASFNSDDFNVSSGAVTLATTSTAAELNLLDGTTAGTIVASKGVAVDANKDITGFRNITLTGELDTGSLDVSGDIDVDGVTNLDVVDIDGAVDMASTLTVASNIVVGGTVDGRDVATDGTKLDGIEASATADQTNAEIRTAVEAATDSNVFTDADHTKLNAIEASADVTDTANVTAAGALMDSELTAIASVKALNQGVATGDSPQFVGITSTANVIVGGNLTVNGTTTTLNTATLDVEDKNITINYGAGDTTGSANGAGITIQDAVDASTDATILWDTTNDEFDFSHPINVAGKVTSTGTSVFASLDISGDIDVDGTTNLDVVDIDGAVDMASTLSVSGDANFDSGSLFVDVSANNVGLGITSPTAQLHLSRGGGTLIKLGTSNNTSEIEVREVGGANSLVFSSNNSVDHLTIADGGGATFSGVITANAGVVVDNITIDGTTIALSSGDLTLDVAGNLKLDTDSSNIYLADGGTDIGLLSTNNQDLNIRNLITDKDIYFQGNDGGSTITALTLDMSDAGTAIFNHDIVMNDNANIFMGNGYDLRLQSDGTNGIIYAANGNLTLDVAGDIILDADGGDIIFKDGGTSVAEIDLLGGNLILSCLTSDEDILFKGNDGGSTIDALVLDMSDAGAATFNSTVTVGSNLLAEDIKAKGSGGLTLQTDDGVKRIILEDSGNVVINETGVDADFRVESDGNANMLFVDGGNNRVGVGNAAPSTILEVTGNGDADTGITTTHSRSGVGFTLGLNNTNNGADKGSGIKWKSGGFDTGAIITRSDAVATSGDAPAYMTFHTSSDGTEDLTERLRLSSTGAATFSSSVRATQLEAYKTNHGGDVSVAANQVGNAYENLASTASLILGATATSTINSTKIVADHSAASGGGTNNHVQDLVFYPVGGNSQNFEAMRISSLGALTVKNVANGHTVFNENGVDADFRVESDSNTHMLFVDASVDRIGIGTSSPDHSLDLDYAYAGATVDCRVSNSDTSNSASGSRILSMVGGSSSGDPRLVVGVTGVQEYSLGIDNSDGDTLKLNNGSSPSSGVNFMSVVGNNTTVFNDAGANLDFRVEGDTAQYALFVDASNDVTSVADADSINAAFADKARIGFNIDRPGIDDHGGHMFMTQVAAEDAWMDICQCHDANATGVLFLIHGVRNIDQNRSYGALVRYAYQNAFNVISVNEQNTTIEYRVSNDMLQYRFTTAGPYTVNLTVMAAG